MRFLFTLFALACWATLAFAQTEQALSPKDQAKDLEKLREQLEKYLVPLGEITPLEPVRQLWDSLAAELDKPRTVLEFYPLIAQAVAACQEGHVFVSGSRDEKSGLNELITGSGAPVLPLGTVSLHDGLYVRYDLSAENTAPPGAKIEALNGVPTSEVLAKIYACMPSDANGLSARRATLTGAFHAYYFWFVAQPEAFELRLLLPSGERKTVTLAARPFASMLEALGERYPGRSSDPITRENFYRLSHWPTYDAAYLELRSFSESMLKQLEGGAQPFTDSIFAEIKALQVEHLVVDVRGNSGGRNEFVWALLPYLNKLGQQGLFSRYTSYDGKDHGTRLEYDLPPAAPREFLIKGKLVVLINGSTFSNASTFAVASAELGSAILIGEPTASRYIGYAGGSWESFYLPKSKILIRVPYFLQTYPFATTREPNTPVQPGVAIYPTIADVLNGRDPILERAKAFLRE